MLYVTTRNQLDTFTAVHTLKQDRGEDGGFWIPFRAPEFSAQQIGALKEKSVNQTIAHMMNQLFGTNLSEWDIDFCIGRYPVRMKELAGKVIVVEPWHNPQWTFDNMVSRLISLVGGDHPYGWPKIAVRISVLFAVYGELLRMGTLGHGEVFDVSVLSGKFVDPISVWYARNWGLPVKSVVCCCNENNSVWNLICYGQMRTDLQCVATCVPEADVTCPEELERLIADCGNQKEVGTYLESCQSGKMYIPAEHVLEKMRQGMYVSVVSSKRIGQTVGGVYSSHGYLLSPAGALVYAGLQDYRSKKGQIRPSLVITQNRPAYPAADLSEASHEEI